MSDSFVKLKPGFPASVLESRCQISGLSQIGSQMGFLRIATGKCIDQAAIYDALSQLT